MARLTGFEPVTARLEGGCSIQLSYRRKAIHDRDAAASTGMTKRCPRLCHLRRAILRGRQRFGEDPRGQQTTHNIVHQVNGCY